MRQPKTPASVTLNRRARFDYHLGDELICGMVLSGPEVRLIRDHHVQLKGSFVTIRSEELWLNNLTLGADTERNIKLLATKKQLTELARARQDGYQLVPTKLLAGGRHIKLAVATGRSKKKYDKRETIKNRDISRSLRSHKNYFSDPNRRSDFIKQDILRKLARGRH